MFNQLTAAATVSAKAGAGKSSVGGKASGAGAAAASGGEGPLRLLYVTPERFIKSGRLMGKLEKLYEV